MKKKVKLVLLLFMFIDSSSYGSAGYIVHKKFRWRNDDGGESSASWAGDVNEAIYLTNRYSAIRLRFAVGNQSATPNQTGVMKLQYCEDPVEQNWKDVPLSDDGLSPFVLSDASGYNHGELTTDLLKPYGMIWQSGGECVEPPGIGSKSVTVETNRYLNVEYCIKATHKACGGLRGYYFRCVTNSILFNLGENEDGDWLPAVMMGDSLSGIAPSFPSGLQVNCYEKTPFNYKLYVYGSEPIRYRIISGPSWVWMSTTNLNHLEGVPVSTGTYYVKVEASNSYGKATGQVKVVVNKGINKPPSVSSINIQCGKNSWQYINISAVDPDTPLTNLVVSIVSGPSKGSAQVLSGEFNLWVKYVPQSNYTGNDEFVFRVSDGINSTDNKCSISVVNDSTSPSTYYNPYNIKVYVKGSSKVEFSLPSFYDNLLQQEDMDYQIVSGPEKDCEVSYLYPNLKPFMSYKMLFKAPDNFSGNVQFIYRVYDGNCYSGMATCIVTVAQNTKPVLAGQSIWVPVGYPPSVVYLGGYGRVIDKDTDQTFRKYEIVKFPLYGKIINFNESKGTFSYVANPGFIGEDYMYVRVSDGIEYSDPARIRFVVREVGKPRALVCILVEKAISNELKYELNILKDDMEHEGWFVKMVEIPSNWNAYNIWEYLRKEYINTNQCFVGALLIGALPVPGNYHNYRQLWVYRTSGQNDNGMDIWISLFAPGATVAQIRNALNANHEYRRGKSRIPFIAYRSYIEEFSDCSSPYYLQRVWPNQKAKMTKGATEARSFVYSTVNTEGAELVYIECHDGGTSEDTGTFSTPSVPQQYRFDFDEGCGAGARQRKMLYSRGGHVVYLTGSRVTWGGGNDPSCMFRSFKCGSLILRDGDCLGVFLMAGGITTWPNYYYEYRQWGDLTIKPKISPPNKFPVINSYKVSKNNPVVGESITFNLSCSDSDANKSDSPYVDYELKIEYFIYGYNGEKPPVLVKTYNSSSANDSVTWSYDRSHRYTVRAEVIDEWLGRAWKDVDVNVKPDSTKPLRINCGGSVDWYDSNKYLWLYDQGYVSGTWGYEGSKTGTGSSGADVIGTSDDYIYQTWRESTATNSWVNYRIPVNNGKYRVVLKLADMSSSKSGERVMKIMVEDNIWFDGLDVYAVAGAKRAYDVYKDITVSDGELKISFIKLTVSTANPYINAIEIIPLDVASSEYPYCKIISPSNGFTTNQPCSISISAEAYDHDGNIQNVSFYLNDSLLGTDDTSPYQYVLNNAPAGEYWITAIATDSSQLKTKHSIWIKVYPYDSDGDGLLDIYDEDDDNDGIKDFEEEIAGTDPRNPASFPFLIIHKVSYQDNNIELKWPSVTGRIYTIEFSTNLDFKNPVIIAENIPATPPQNIYYVTIQDKYGFFRIKVRKE